MIEDDCVDNVIPLPNVTSKIIAKVIEYCKKHVKTPKTEDPTTEDEIKTWDAEFVKVDQTTLFDLILILEMAFCNKLSGLLRQGVSQTKGFNGQLSMAMMNSIRHMSSSNLFVGCLSWGTNDDALKESFSNFGEVTEARVIIDRQTERSRGFGFVSFTTTEDADSASSAMDGKGCDASVLLDAIDGFENEKEAPPNETLKGFDAMDFVKSKDGGPFYPLLNGRRDNNVSYAQIATHELPSQDHDLSSTLSAFASRGFDVRETAALLGAHSFGMISCKFFKTRLYNSF